MLGQAPAGALGFWNMGQYANFSVGSLWGRDRRQCKEQARTLCVHCRDPMRMLNSHSSQSSSALGPWNCSCTSGKLCWCPGVMLHSVFAPADCQLPLRSGARFLKKAWAMQLFLLKILHATGKLTRGSNLIKTEWTLVNLATRTGQKPLLLPWNVNRILF